MESSSLQHNGPTPLLFKQDNGDNLELWVHPSIDGYTELVRTIKENGGTVVDSPETANFVIVGSEMSSDQLEFVVSGQLDTVVLAPSWVDDCVSHNKIQLCLNHILLLSREGFENYCGMLVNDASEFQDGSEIAVNADGRCFLAAAKHLLSEDSSRPWEDVYSLCALEDADKKESFWIDLNGPGTRVREKADILRTLARARDRYDDLLRGLRRPSEESISAKPSETSQLQMKGPTPEEDLGLIRHLATDPPGSQVTVWENFHTKYPHRTAGAWEQYYTTKKDYFDQQIQAYRSEKSPDLVAKDATRSKSSDATTSNAKLNRNVEVVIHRTPNGKTQHNGAPNTGSTSGIEPPPSIRGRGFAFTDEEKRSMKEYWACNISKDRSSASALWERYAELHPHRSPGAWNALARRHPELFPMKSPGKNGGPDEDEFEDDRNDDYDDYNDGDESHSHTYNGTLARLRPYTKEEEDSLIDFIGKQGETIPGNAWVEFQREHTSRTVVGWRSRYQLRKAYYKAEASIRSQQPRKASALLLPSAPKWRSPPPDPLSTQALKRVRSFELYQPNTVKRRRSDGHGHVHSKPPTKPGSSSENAGAQMSSLNGRPESGATMLDGPLPKSATPDISITAPLPGFTRQDLQAAMAWVASRELPTDLHENVSSWENFATLHSNHDAEGWVRLYYYHFDLFKGMEAQINCFT